MSTRLLFASLSLAALSVFSGCATTSTNTADTATPRVIIPAITATPVAITAAPVVSQAGAPVASVISGPRPVAVAPASQGVPVYIPPKITATTLAPYVDEKGRLFGPQVMYEKVTEGKMNVDALQNPDLAYIPQENLVVPPGMGNPVSSPAMMQKTQEASRLPSDAIDPRDIVVTGLLSKEANAAEAQRMATAAGRRAQFDPDLGWVLLPLPVTR